MPAGGLAVPQFPPIASARGTERFALRSMLEFKRKRSRRAFSFVSSPRELPDLWHVRDFFQAQKADKWYWPMAVFCSSLD